MRLRGDAQARDDGTKAIQIGIAAFMPWRKRLEKDIKGAGSGFYA
jgi:hypothetical protein